jgi:hypothetical protein
LEILLDQDKNENRTADLELGNQNSLETPLLQNVDQEEEEKEEE